MTISEKTHPELARSINHMKTIVCKDHTETEWKRAVLRVLCAIAEEIAQPMMVVNSHAPAEDVNQIMGRLKEKYGPQRTFDGEPGGVNYVRGTP